MGFFQRLLRPLLLTKARKMELHARPFVKGKVLDIGAGRCYIAAEISARQKREVTCIDVEDLNQTRLKLTVYDGKRIPFGKDSFDTALIAYVLHHCENQEEMLKEAKRVCRGNIIIFEDTWVSPVTKAMDFISNRLHGVETPFLFQDIGGWKRTFRRHGLRLVAVEDGVEKEWFYPFVRHTMFVVRKK